MLRCRVASDDDDDDDDSDNSDDAEASMDAKFDNFAKRDGPTDRRSDGQTERQTQRLIGMRWTHPKTP